MRPQRTQTKNLHFRRLPTFTGTVDGVCACNSDTGSIIAKLEQLVKVVFSSMLPSMAAPPKPWTTAFPSLPVKSTVCATANRIPQSQVNLAQRLFGTDFGITVHYFENDDTHSSAGAQVIYTYHF